MERLAEVILHGRMDPALMATRVFHGFEKIEEALAMMRSKAPDVIKPVVICE
jgi:alcohol dehydrogenase (NADP+)